MKKEKISLDELLVKSSDKALGLQAPEGSFPGGHNGPWHDNETPLRTTAHWAMLFYKAYDISGEKKFLSASLKACEFLSLPRHRPYDYTFSCRNSKGKNKCNGLIGQAWVLEPLICLGKNESIKKYLNLAKNVIDMHRYSFKYSAWEDLEIDGTQLGVNKTLNQQIWFTAMVLWLGQAGNIKEYIAYADDFILSLGNKISLLEDGLISHDFTAYPTDKAKKTLKKLLAPQRYHKEHSEKYFRSLGYQTFNLYGLAMINDLSPQAFTKNNKLCETIRKSIEYVVEAFPFGLDSKEEDFRWSYNPAGIEIFYAAQSFKNLKFSKHEEEVLREYLNKQFQNHLNKETFLMEERTNDKDILSARLYEAVRLENVEIDIPI